MSAVIDLLKRQHREVLDRIDEDQARLAEPRAASRFLDFLEADVIAHFRLEEDLLFPELAKVPPIADGPLRVMGAEHAVFRDLLAAGKQGRDRGDTRGLTQAANDIAVLLRAHIAKEDGVLFPMALEVLSEEQLRDLDAAGGKAS